ncbi:MAG: beta-lactamase family protein [Taibaiella sp.]|nr:beta-lactamase family protein [Taibaiella sp.]
MEESNTVAFLIIRNDSIRLEQYANEYEASSPIASFSMAKSFTSVLIGMAIEDGWIQSEEDLVIRYIPELKDNGFEQVTIRHLLQMTSGLDFNESYYSPFSEAADFYYGTRLRRAILNLKLKNPPGIQFEYTSGNTQLLGLVLERALRDRTINTVSSGENLDTVTDGV